MAEPASLNRSPTTRAEVEELVKSVTAARPASLPALWLPLRADDSGGKTVVGVCYLVQVRAGGFMICFPTDVGDFQPLVENFQVANETAEPAFHSGMVEIITMRGRGLGQAECTLVDLPWDTVEQFYKSAALRGSLVRSIELEQFTVGDTAGRPTARSVIELANQWILGDLDRETAEEYFSAGDFQPDEADGDPMTASEIATVEGLKAQVAQLTAQLSAVQSTRPPPVPPMPGIATNSNQLFQGQAQTLGAQDLGRLRQLAGTRLLE